MYMYIYIYIYCIYVYVYIYIYLFTYIFNYVYIYMCLCVLKSCWVGDGRRWGTTTLTIESLSGCIILHGDARMPC